MIAFIFAAVTLGFLLGIVGLIFWLFWRGNAFWQAGEKDKALLLWTAGILIILAPIVAVVNNQQTQQAQTRERVERQVAYEEEVRQAEHNLANLVSVAVLERSIPEAALGCRSNCDQVYAKYLVTNNSPLTIEVSSTVNMPGVHCGGAGAEWGWVFDTLRARQAMTTYCVVASRFFSTATPNCLNVRYSNYPNSKQVICG